LVFLAALLGLLLPGGVGIGGEDEYWREDLKWLSGVELGIK